MGQAIVQEKQQNNKLIKGMIIGGVIGGFLTLIDRNTRSAVATKAVDIKDSSKNVIMHVKENPGEVKEQLLEQVKQATDTLKHTIQEAKNLAERINRDVIKEVKEISNEAVSFAEDTKEEYLDIQSNVKDTSSKLTESTKNRKHKLN
jgi:gas vesicle protein